MERFKLVIILGPTAIGKSELAIRLATHLQCDVISADSRQIYKEMNIGTAKPTRFEKQGIKHHMMDIKGIREYYSAGRYEQDVIGLIDGLSGNQPHSVMAGGSGLYIQAVCKGIDEMPDPDFSIRDRLISRMEEEGLESLVNDLQSLDPESWTEIDRQNPKRVIRALEIIYQTSEKYSSIKKGQAKSREFDYIKIGLESEREILYERINQRADRMLEQGLLQEVQELFPYRNLTALRTVGYQEFFGYMEGAYDLEEAIRLFKRNSRRYAKKQIAWFNRDPEVHWFFTGSFQNILTLVEKFLNSQ
ncbi:MAG: tRNA (adenosine(37)-N6)-dimethylallyltransferase MiaA [Cyclobacteriaceae bacterium]|nr:tRNA (adenosine(37)-N6)-dimethylallyltransferase MiaA [Cyclobacteriaceae bacterium]